MCSLVLRRAEDEQVVPEMGITELNGILEEAEPQGQVVPTMGHNMVLHNEDYLHDEEEDNEHVVLGFPIPEEGENHLMFPLEERMFMHLDTSRVVPQGDDDDSLLNEYIPLLMPAEHVYSSSLLYIDFSHTACLE